MLGPLQAEQQLAAIEAALVPHLKPEAAGKIMRRYTVRAEGPAAKPESLHEALMGAGIPVRRIPANKQQQKSTGNAGTGRKGEDG